MEFRFEDFLKKIIPGFVLLVGVVTFMMSIYGLKFFTDIVDSGIKQYSEVVLIILLLVCYLLGYFNDSIGSLIENKILYTIHNKPSYYILSNNCNDKYKVKVDLIFAYVQTKWTYSISELKNIPINKEQAKREASHIFRMINNNKSKDDNIIKEFYYSYIFSRNILISYFISGLLICISFIFAWYIYIFMISIFMILYNRRIEKSYYYSKKVLLTVL